MPDIIYIVLIFALAFSSGTGVGFSLGRIKGKSSTIVSSTGYEPEYLKRWGDREPHTHVYDTRLNDGLGMRCGLCGKPKGTK